MDREISSTEKAIESKERWERVQYTLPMDEFGDGGGIREYSKLVGAEEERTRLERLLTRRRELLGEAAPETEEKRLEVESQTGVAARLRSMTEGKAAPDEKSLKQQQKGKEQEQANESAAQSKNVKGSCPPRRKALAARLGKGGKGGLSDAEREQAAAEKAEKAKERQAKAEAKRKELLESKKAKAKANSEAMLMKKGLPAVARRALHPMVDPNAKDPKGPVKRSSNWEDEPVRLGGSRLPTAECNSQSGLLQRITQTKVLPALKLTPAPRLPMAPDIGASPTN